MCISVTVCHVDNREAVMTANKKYPKGCYKLCCGTSKGYTCVNISVSTCVIRTLGRLLLSAMELSLTIDGHHEVLDTCRRMYVGTTLLQTSEMWKRL